MQRIAAIGIFHLLDKLFLNESMRFTLEKA